MEKDGKLIVIESNDNTMKNAVIDVLVESLRDSNIFFKNMDATNDAVSRFEQIAKSQFGRDLEWTTSFLFAEAALLETISYFNGAEVGKNIRAGKCVIIDQFDASIYVNIVTGNRALNVLFNTVNDHVISMLLPVVSVFIGVEDPESRRFSEHKSDLKRYLSYYSKMKKKGRKVEIINSSDKSFTDICDQVEKIVREAIGS